jgi:hypothetical protein
MRARSIVTENQGGILRADPPSHLHLEFPMRLPRMSAVRSVAAAAQPRAIQLAKSTDRSRRQQSRQSGIRPQKLCIPGTSLCVDGEIHVKL